MTQNIIQLLPDHVANQIAAGEVIQRPASVVKELIENAVDSGAGSIQLIIQDAGKTLIQVIDDGSGMGASDAQMCFERHATSKITSAEDLFLLKSKGFRGEALASIAAIAHIELKTRLAQNELGTHIVNEGSAINTNEPCSCSVGTSISVKNLFYNVPARRKFLKSDAAEMKHVIEEFIRVALVHPSIAFSLTHNAQEIHQLESGPLKRRIVDIFGKSYESKLVPIKESTEIVAIEGFVVKPEYAKRSRGEQYFFANQRFIKSYSLNQSVHLAFDNLLPQGTFAGFFIYLNVDPQCIDVNIHPTKTEVKFEDEKAIFAILKSAVKQALSRYAVAPSLDFEVESSFNIEGNPSDNAYQNPAIKVNPDFNPFKQQKTAAWEKGKSFGNTPTNFTQNWQELFTDNTKDTPSNSIHELNFEDTETPVQQNFNYGETTNNFKIIQQLFHKYILVFFQNALYVVQQRRAHERVLFDYFNAQLQNSHTKIQQSLFPDTLEVNAKEASVLSVLLPDLKLLGFDINPFGKNTYVINGTPADIPGIDAKSAIEHLIEQYQLNESDFKQKRSYYLAKNMASKVAIASGQKLQREEMEELIHSLLQSTHPQISPIGKRIWVKYDEKDLLNLFD